MAHLRHKRDANARRIPSAAKIAAPVAVFVTLGVVGAGVVTTDPDVREAFAAANGASIAQVSASERKDEFLSRSFSRTDGSQARGVAARVADRKATAKAIRQADTKLWTTVDLNLWTEPGKKAKKTGIVMAEKKVLVTGRRANGRAEVVLDEKAFWVTADYLSKDKPEQEEEVVETESEGSDESAPAAGGTCSNGTSVPSGVSSNIVNVHASVCGAFPEITTYGTLRGGGGDHGSGRAVDIMVSGSRGWQVANFVRDNAGSLGVSYVIYSQNIWSVERGGEGWRGMSDRGSSTANHYDHVHVSTY
ncbi:hypothetical protein [Nocardioides donggukensis]|uniref:ARB-07466-like C-terminal domain-containing protein n=1 Tax=Nocardioides donggukensis TaxID=2774019 RepID=A0A927K4C3_9ACTN|nr:hypothetical protein [Nocardioides donggukensis]MBD8869974.1 hypothetical protein [Nocardioides donggukensis]